MYGKSDQPQQWSVHAEFTISHPGISDPENLPQTHTEQNDNGVRMTYTWTPPDNPSSWSSQSNPPSCSASNRSISSDAGKYGFQKGNLLFTSTPPRKPPHFLPEATSKLFGGVQDSSGYGSDLLSPNSLASGSLPRPILPYNRKCRSTCNITLSTNVGEKGKSAEDSLEAPRQVSGRTQSLRCQTPTVRCDAKDNYYGCGDPWCHHLHYGDEFSCTGRCSPVLEACESCLSSSTLKPPTRASTFTTPTQKTTEKKDACVQTTEMIDKCTSPFMRMGSFNFNKQESLDKKYSSAREYTRHKTEPLHQRTYSPSIYTPDSLDGTTQQRKSRSPKAGRVTSPQTKTNELSDQSKGSDSSKKPRTVHIDVYCTGTELESEASASGSENDTASTPQTVFESGKVHITRKNASSSDLPYHLQSQKVTKTLPENKEASDDESTSYPSKLSSYSTIRDFSSSISSVPKSWTTYSRSSMTVPDDFDSVANTSWKDTFSDIDSLLQSRSSIAQTDSYDFSNRKLFTSNSIDETPEIENKKFLDTPSNTSLQYSDSFEYANSEDKLRIKRMEDMWKHKQKQWKSPQSERKQLLLQQKKMQDYIDSKLGKHRKWDSKESDSDSDDSVKGWTFVKGVDGEKTKVPSPDVKTTEEVPEVQEIPKVQDVPQAPTLDLPKDNQETDNNSVADSPPSPNTQNLQQRLSLDPTLRSPFTLFPGIYTEQRHIANRFGRVVNVLRKPGHHIGPAKNPDCLCDHCQRYFESIGYRNRTRSMGDSPSYQVQNWKTMFQRDTCSSDRTADGILFTDF